MSAIDPTQKHKFAEGASTVLNLAECSHAVSEVKHLSKQLADLEAAKKAKAQ